MNIIVTNPPAVSVLERLRSLASASANAPAHGAETAHDAQPAKAAPKQDKSDIATNWEKQVQEALDALKSNYRGVHVFTGTISDADALRQYAAALGGGSYLVLSQEFLQNMAKDEASFQKGRALLESLFQRLSAGVTGAVGTGAYVDSDEVSFWTIAPEKSPAPPRQNTEPPKSFIDIQRELELKIAKNRFEMKLSSSALNSSSAIASKLARAQSIQSVKTVLSEAESCKCTLRLTIALGSNADRQKARMILAQLDRAITNGGRKIKSLTEEDDLRARQKIAQRRQQCRKAEQLKAERQKKELLRHIRDHAMLTESKSWVYYQEDLQRLHSPFEDEPEEYIPFLVTTDLAPIADFSMGGAGDMVTFAAADCSVVTVAIADL